MPGRDAYLDGLLASDPSRVGSTEDGVAHTVEETSRLLRLLAAAESRLQFFDTRVGALERLVLDKGCLHQRVGGLRRASQAVRDHALGSRVAGAILQFGQAIEQFFHQFLLLRVMRLSLAFTSAAYVGYPVG